MIFQPDNRKLFPEEIHNRVIVVSLHRLMCTDFNVDNNWSIQSVTCVFLLIVIDVHYIFCEGPKDGKSDLCARYRSVASVLGRTMRNLLQKTTCIQITRNYYSDARKPSHL